MKGNFNAEPDQYHGTTQGDHGNDEGSHAPEPGPGRRGEGGRSKMAWPAWLSWFAQRGSDPPFMLKYRSSDGFIIGTVALAVFTVCPGVRKDGSEGTS